MGLLENKNKCTNQGVESGAVAAPDPEITWPAEQVIIDPGLNKPPAPQRPSIIMERPDNDLILWRFVLSEITDPIKVARLMELVMQTWSENNQRAFAKALDEPGASQPKLYEERAIIEAIMKWDRPAQIALFAMLKEHLVEQEAA
jgi:hypothetical protein